MTSEQLEELADKHVVSFITYHTNWEVDDALHSKMVLAMLNFYRDAKALENPIRQKLEELTDDEKF